LANALKANDQVPVGTNATVTLVPGTGPAAAQGVLTLNQDGTFTFVPAPSYVGTVTFQYRLTNTVTAAVSQAAVRIVVPPLRARPEDIPVLAQHFARSLGNAILAPEVLRELAQRAWPGNVRELRNVVERSAYLSPNGVIDLITPGAKAPARETPVVFDPTLTFREQKERAIELFEEAYLAWLLQRAEGNISRAAREADMDRKYLHKLLRRYGIDAKQFASGRASEHDRGDS